MELNPCTPSFGSLTHFAGDVVGVFGAIFACAILADHVKPFAQQPCHFVSTVHIGSSALAILSIGIVGNERMVLPSTMRDEEARTYFIVSGGYDMVCAVCAAVQASVALLVTWGIAVFDGILLKGATAFCSGRDSYDFELQMPDLP